MPSGTKKTSKAAGEGSVAWREEQRNRLAQKAVRERRAAQIQQLEQQLATVTNGDDTARVNQLLDANCRLRRELLDTRKKLASLAATATQLGERIKIVLDEQSDGEPESCDDENQTDSPQDPTHQWNGSPQPTTSSPQLTVGEPATFTQETTLAQVTERPFPGEGTGFDLEPACMEISPMQGDGQQDIPVTLAFDGDHNFNGHGGFAAGMSDILHRPEILPKLRVYTGSAFSQHLEYIHKLLRLGGVREGSSSLPHAVDVMVSAFLDQGWPSLKYWMHATQSLPLASRVLWWQTSNSHEAATQVPPGNSPTLIQLSRPQYPCILDWVPHPRLRDMLILDYESYDVDQVICDMTNSFVVEVEDNTPIFDETGSALPVVGKGYGYNLMELVEMTSLFGPVENDCQEELTVIRLLQNMTASEYVSVHPMHQFRLDPQFFHKYPALYDPNAESRYRPKDTTFARTSQPPPPFTTDTAKAYMSAALHAKSSWSMAR